MSVANRNKVRQLEARVPEQKPFTAKIVFSTRIGDPEAVTSVGFVENRIARARRLEEALKTGEITREELAAMMADLGPIIAEPGETATEAALRKLRG
jgi:hypothetical protein